MKTTQKSRFTCSAIWRTAQVCESLRFMEDADSPFRRRLASARCYPELPFTVSAAKGEPLFDKLAALCGVKDETRIDISGKNGLALRFPEGTWQVLDYKTDHMMPRDGGDRAAFHARLNAEYGGQLEMYRIMLEHLSREAVSETTILSV